MHYYTCIIGICHNIHVIWFPRLYSCVHIHLYFCQSRRELLETGTKSHREHWSCRSADHTWHTQTVITSQAIIQIYKDLISKETSYRFWNAAYLWLKYVLILILLLGSSPVMWWMVGVDLLQYQNTVGFAHPLLSYF